jgi:hypothetical protein
MTHSTQTCVESSLQDERTAATVQTLQATQAMRQLKLDELRVVAGGPIIQNQDT